MALNVDIKELQELYQAMTDKLRADGCEGCMHADKPE